MGSNPGINRFLGHIGGRQVLALVNSPALFPKEMNYELYELHNEHEGLLQLD